MSREWSDPHDRWLAGGTPSTQRSKYFDGWHYIASPDYQNSAPARAALASMTYSRDWFPDSHFVVGSNPRAPQTKRGRERFRGTGVSETLSPKRLVREIHRRIDEIHKLESDSFERDGRGQPTANMAEPRKAQAKRERAQLAILIHQLFEAENYETPIFDEVAEQVSEPSDVDIFTERPLKPVVELLTRSFDRAPGAPNNG